MSSSFRHYAVLVTLGMAILWIDFFSKAYIYYLLPISSSLSSLYPYGGVGIFENFLGIEFSIGLAFNRGAAWGIFADFQHLLLGLRMVLIGGMLLYLVFFSQKRKIDFPLVLIIAGAIGNVTDFFLYGQVIDFIHFKFWGYDFPLFNVADLSITIGVFWLALISLFSSSKQKEME